MIEPRFLLFEVLMIILALICIFDIWQKRTIEPLFQSLLEFLIGIVYGITLELMTISAFHFYSYGLFYLMFLDVPVSIGIGWGVIIYATKIITEKMSLKVFQKALLAGLLALNIDLSMDIIAVKIGFWKWGFGNSYEYFFIPFGNFYAWFNVISSFVFFLYLFEIYKNDILNKYSGIFSFLCSLAYVLITNLFYVYILPDNLWTHFIMTWGLIGFVLIYLLTTIIRKQINVIQSYPITPKLVFIGFHAFFFLMGIIEGVFTVIIFLFISLLMIIIIEILLEGEKITKKLTVER